MKNRFYIIFTIAGVAAMSIVSSAYAASNINKAPVPIAADDVTVAQFTKTIDDLPLMPGLEPVDENDVLFVAGKDRIAESTATGAVNSEAVYRFYQQSLPQLGWRSVDDRTYERGNERLRIDVSTANPPKAATVVRFSLQPAGND